MAAMVCTQKLFCIYKNLCCHNIYWKTVRISGIIVSTLSADFDPMHVTLPLELRIYCRSYCTSAYTSTPDIVPQW